MAVRVCACARVCRREHWGRAVSGKLGEEQRALGGERRKSWWVVQGKGAGEAVARTCSRQAWKRGRKGELRGAPLAQRRADKCRINEVTRVVRGQAMPVD